MRIIAVILLALASPAAAGQARAPVTYGAEPRPISNWTVRPDGSGLAYLVGPDPIHDPTGPVTLTYLDLASGQTRVVSQYLTEPRSSIQAEAANANLAWSPDGSRLAFILPRGRRSQLQIWSIDGTERRFDRAACHNGPGCQAAIAWAPDSRTVYFIAPLAPDAASGVAPSPRSGNGTSAVPSPTDVRVVESPRPRIDPGTNSASRDVLQTPVALLAADIASGQLRTLASGAAFQTLALSPDGRTMLALARGGDDRVVRQSYRDAYLIPTVGTRPPRGAPDFRVPYSTVAWAPDSTRFAMISAGALASGDVVIHELASGRQTTISRGTLPLEAGEIRSEVPLEARSFIESNGRFRATGLRWSADGRAIFALRPTRFDGGWRTRLWRIGLDGAMRNLTAGSDVDIVSPAVQPPSGRVDGILALVRTGDGAVAVARMADGGGAPGVAIVATIPGRVVSSRVESVGSGRYLSFVHESSALVPEVALFDTAAASLSRVTRVNGAVGLARPVEVRRIEWRFAGQHRFGFLYLPEGSSGRTPLIVSVYPREPDYPPADGGAYVGRRDLFNPSLLGQLEAGYALFKPDIPVVGGGRSCADVAGNISAALDAIASERLADTDRAAIIGISFGGWAVGCAISHGNRFRAAISIAGIADLPAMSFSIHPFASNLGIGGGQVRIGRSIWDAPDLFWQESPISRLPHVATPLLLIHGDADTAVPIAQSEAMFSGLRRLDRRAVLVTYAGVGHDAGSHPEFAPRIARWLADHIGLPE